ncbi:MAG: response regulator [Deltaproteobacteria bacterium]|nr:response regulator [Deltaproteobacteria bacterium]
METNIMMEPMEDANMARPAILIVDDEKRLLKSLARLLEDSFQVHTASGVEEGLSILDREAISLALLDINMPGMTGVDMLKKIRQEMMDLKVIMMTGRRDYESVVKCADLNVQGFIEKPFDVDVLAERMQLLIGGNCTPLLSEILGDDCEELLSSLSATTRAAIEYIEKSFHLNINREKIAAYLEISPAYLSTLFHKDCHIHLKRFINRYKMIYCKKKLENNPYANVKELARSIGVSDVNHFGKLFKKETGMTPLKFKDFIIRD